MSPAPSTWQPFDPGEEWFAERALWVWEASWPDPRLAIAMDDDDMGEWAYTNGVKIGSAGEPEPTHFCEPNIPTMPSMQDDSHRDWTGLSATGVATTPWLKTVHFVASAIAAVTVLFFIAGYFSTQMLIRVFHDPASNEHKLWVATFIPDLAVGGLAYAAAFKFRKTRHPMLAGAWEGIGWFLFFAALGGIVSWLL